MRFLSDVSEGAVRPLVCSCLDCAYPLSTSIYSAFLESLLPPRRSSRASFHGGYERSINTVLEWHLIKVKSFLEYFSPDNRQRIPNFYGKPNISNISTTPVNRVNLVCTRSILPRSCNRVGGSHERRSSWRAIDKQVGNLLDAVVAENEPQSLKPRPQRVQDRYRKGNACASKFSCSRSVWVVASKRTIRR